MKKQLNEKRFWTCIIGSYPDDLLPDGCDAPMRSAVKKAYIDITGHWDEDCWSGWGTNERKKEVILAVSVLGEDTTLFHKIENMLKERGHIE